MARGLATAFKTAFGGTVIYPAFFAEFQFDSGTDRYWTGDTNISANLGDGAVTWVGSALFGETNLSGESEAISARQLAFKMNGVDTTFYSSLVATEFRGRPVKVWFALMDSTHATVSYYYLLEEARMDQLTVDESGDTIDITLTCESRLIDMFTARRSHLNSDTHKKVHPDDDFYGFVPKLPGQRLPWGISKALGRITTPNTDGGSQNPADQSQP